MDLRSMFQVEYRLNHMKLPFLQVKEFIHWQFHMLYWMWEDKERGTE
jgi:hypothetical protein